MSDTQSVTINVTDVNEAPTAIIGSATITVSTGTLISADMGGWFSDPDEGDSLTLTVKYDGGDLPTWLTYDASTLLLSGTAPWSALGTHAITVTATDSKSLSATFDNFQITIFPSHQVFMPVVSNQ